MSTGLNFPWTDLEIAHFGFVTETLDDTAEALNQLWGIDWFPSLDADLVVRVHGRRETHHVRSFWSIQGPPHIELIQAVPASPWLAHDGLDHIGYWVDREVLDRTVARCSPSLLDAVTDDPSGTSIIFAYLRDTFLGRIELVDRRRQASISESLEAARRRSPK